MTADPVTLSRDPHVDRVLADLNRLRALRVVHDSSLDPTRKLFLLSMMLRFACPDAPPAPVGLKQIGEDR